MTEMTPEIYSIWAAAKKEARPWQTPPTLEQTNELMKMFGFTVESLLGLREDECTT